MSTPVSRLERNPTYKEQQQQISNKDLGNAGFLCYPVLMAADILMYRPHGVPVGEDQLPHMELTREIARRSNYLYGGDLLPEPKAMLTPAAKLPRTDGRKMSKRYNNGTYPLRPYGGYSQIELLKSRPMKTQLDRFMLWM